MKREDCYFYMKYPDMGASIPICSRYRTMGKCPCENCNRFLSKIKASQIIIKYLDGELVERSKGEWIETTVRGSKSLVCSKCGADLGSICETNFCPDCGADMRGTE